VYLLLTSIGSLVTAIEAKDKNAYRRHAATILLFYIRQKHFKVTYYPKIYQYTSSSCMKGW
jgi:hypothetical protein